jgi:hypothetical protein
VNPRSCFFFPLVAGGADEAERCPGTAHQLHPQDREDHQGPRLGGGLSGASPAHPGPGAGGLEDIHPPLLCVPGVLPSLHVSGDVTLVSLQSMGSGRRWGGEAHACMWLDHVDPWRHPIVPGLPPSPSPCVSPGRSGCVCSPHSGGRR